MNAADDGNRKADDDIFEICDFTVVTDMEHLIVALETALIEWKLNGSSVQSPSADCFKHFPKDFLSACTWKVSSQTFEHLNRRFRLLYYKCTPEDNEDEVVTVSDSDSDNEPSHQTKAAIAMSTTLADFVPSIISTQFGILDFVVLSDADNDVALREDVVLMILSAIQCATVNTDCDVPILVQVGPMKNFLYNGLSQNRHVRTSFEGSFVRRPLYNHDNLSGLMAVLREKVATPISPLPRMFAAIQFDYCLQEKLDGSFNNDFPDVNIDLKSLVCLSNAMLPFGSSADPLKEFRLAVRWPNLAENVMNENQAFTDLEPDYAPFWFASVDLNPSVPCLLFDGLKRIVKLVSSESGSFKMSEYVQTNEAQPANSGANALSKLTAEHSSTYKIVPSGLEEDTLSEEKAVVREWIKKLFSENTYAEVNRKITIPGNQPAKVDSTHCGTAPGTAVKADVNNDEFVDLEHEKKVADFCIVADEVTKIIANSKNAPCGSFTERVSLCLCKALMVSDNGLVLFSLLWTDIVKELRTLWENSVNLPGFSEGQVPDLASSLLHQKLQMLQCCIDARRRSYEMYDETRDFNSDVFFDALEDVNDGITATSVSSDRPEVEPVGRCSVAEGLFYLHDSNKEIYVPVTQDRSPMTEDMIEEHTEYLSSLNDSEARMNAQISSLMSDMQAFKAANPGCCMADFVRWHSPRDWVDADGDGIGHLSERMSTEGNMWQLTWNEATAIPVSLQKRLFNFSGDAEKILQRFENTTVAELLTMILPIIFSSSVLRLVDEAKFCTQLTDIDRKLQKIAKTTMYLSSANATTDDYLDLLREVKSVELVISYVKAVYSHFSNLCTGNEQNCVREFATTLVDRYCTRSTREAQPPEEDIRRQLVPVIGAPSSDLAVVVRKLMETDERVLAREEGRSETKRKPRTDAKYPPPERKQYIIRWCAPRPGYNSRPGNHRLYVNIEKDEFRVCASVTDDIVLM